MGLFDINEHFLQQRLPGLRIDYAQIVDRLNLDPAHLQLLADCYECWQKFKLPDSFWIYLLLLVDEINRGSSCVDMSSKRFHQHQKHYKLPPFSDMSIALEKLTLANNPVLVQDQQFLYFEKYHEAETNLKRQIEALIHGYHGSEYDQAQIKSVLEPVFSSMSYPLNREQMQAVITGLLKPFSLVSGGPGTGKTTMVASLLNCLHALGVSVKDMALAAPTGRAAYRMTASLQLGIQHSFLDSSSNHPLAEIEAQTIHRLLGKSRRLNQDNRYHSGYKLPFKLIVIDEVSMVDLHLMTELLAAVDSDCRVVLVGDQFQLPSVESGAVLADLMPPANRSLTLSIEFADILSDLIAPFLEESAPISDGIENKPRGLLVDSCTILKKSHRSVQSIQSISELVRIGDAEGFFKHPELNIHTSQSSQWAPVEGVQWLPELADKSAGLEVIWHWFQQHIDLVKYKSVLDRCQGFEAQSNQHHQDVIDAIFQHIQNQQILTLLNQGVSGQQLINRYLCQKIKQQWQLESNQKHFHGQMVMMRQNDYDKQLFNGDIGVILKSNKGWQAVFPGSNGYRFFALSLLPELVTAFAITVHKSQGSEYPHVFIPLPEDINNRLLTREIIYTGMTRAKSSVLIYAEQAALSHAIKSHSERQTGLQFW